MWVRVAVAAACFLTVVAAVVGPHALLEQVPWYVRDDYDVASVRDGLWVLLFVWIVVSLAPAGNRWLQLAVLLPVGHLVAMVIAWAEWTAYAELLPDWMSNNPVARALPPSTFLIGLAAICAIAGWLAARCRMRDALHAATMIALIDLLLLGLWLPIATQLWASDVSWLDPKHALVIALDAHPAPILASVLLPPLVVAIVAATVAHRNRGIFARRREPLWVCLGILLLAALIARGVSSYGASVLYADFVPLLLVTAIAAIGMLVTLAIGLWWRDRRSRRALAVGPGRFEGIVATSEEVPSIGGVEITSWLRGPCVVLSPCTVTTRAGELVVPGGAELVAHVPPQSTTLLTGEVAVVLRAGDRVTVSGYVPPDPDHPFRGSAALVPERVRVARHGDDGSASRDVMLSMWRPCVAYLAILAAIALPAVVIALDDDPPRHHSHGHLFR